MTRKYRLGNRTAKIMTSALTKPQEKINASAVPAAETLESGLKRRFYVQMNS